MCNITCTWHMFCPFILSIQYRTQVYKEWSLCCNIKTHLSFPMMPIFYIFLFWTLYMSPHEFNYHAFVFAWLVCVVEIVHFCSTQITLFFSLVNGVLECNILWLCSIECAFRYHGYKLGMTWNSILSLFPLFADCKWRRENLRPRIGWAKRGWTVLELRQESEHFLPSPFILIV